MKAGVGQAKLTRSEPARRQDQLSKFYRANKSLEDWKSRPPSGVLAEVS